MSNASLKEQLEAVASKLSGPEQKVSKRIPTNKSKTPKPRWLDYAHYGVDLLKAYFPSTFKSGNQIKPLKKGIKEDLVKKLSVLAEVAIDDKACMVKSLSYYVNTLQYHKSVIKDAERIDLEGKPAGTVSS